jgi:hypothetical protein
MRPPPALHDIVARDLGADRGLCLADGRALRVGLGADRLDSPRLRFSELVRIGAGQGGLHRSGCRRGGAEHGCENLQVPSQSVSISSDMTITLADGQELTLPKTIGMETDLAAANGWDTSGTAEHSELGASGYGGIDATSGGFWFDTQNSPGGAHISHEFADATAAGGGVTSVLSFDITTQSLNFNGQHYATDPNATFEFRIDGNTVKQFNADDFTAGERQHFDVAINGDWYSGGTQHTLAGC